MLPIARLTVGLARAVTQEVRAAPADRRDHRVAVERAVRSHDHQSGALGAAGPGGAGGPDRVGDQPGGAAGAVG